MVRQFFREILIILTYIIRLSKLFRSMSKLAVLLKRALSSFHEVLAHLSLVFLLECVDLPLVPIEVVIVWLIGEAAEHFTWWIVEVAWSTVGVEALALISTLLRLATGARGQILRLGAFWGSWCIIRLWRSGRLAGWIFGTWCLLGCLELLSINLLLLSLWQAIGSTNRWNVTVQRHFLVLIWNLWSNKIS